MSAATLPFRFDAVEHEYWSLVTGERLPHITAMLEHTGWIDRRWYTEEQSARGVLVHQMATEYDYGQEDVERRVSPHRGYLLAYIAILKLLRPVWSAIEVPLVHPHYRFGGRPDRVGTITKLRAVVELKSGGPTPADRVQLALQAILAAAEGGLPASSYARFAFHLKATGKYKVVRYDNPADFDEAHSVIRQCCAAG